MADTWKVITGADLTIFDEEMRDIALKASMHGWLGRRSSKGHLIMRAPDGETTISIARQSGRRSARNARADFERWQRNQPGRALGLGEPDPAELESIMAYFEGEAKRDERVKEFISGLLSEGASESEVHGRLEILGQPNETTWVLLDRLTRYVIAWSPRMSEDDAYALAYGNEPVEVVEDTGHPESEEVIPVDPDKGHACDECDKSFDSARALASHQRKHSLSTFQCPECGKDVKYLERHMARHHPEASDSGPQEERPATVKRAGIHRSLDKFLDEVEAEHADLETRLARALERVRELEQIIADRDAKLELAKEALSI